MKKIVLTFILSTIILPASAFAPPNAATINVHDMQSVYQQKFRMEEINDYKEVKEEQERFKKRMESYEKPAINNNQPAALEPELVDDNGKIKIEYKN